MRGTASANGFDLGEELLKKEEEKRLASLTPPGLFEDYLAYTSTFSEAPPEFHIFTMAHCVSCIIGRGLWIEQGVERIYPNLYTLLVALSSLYKKSSSADLCRKLLSLLGLLKDRWLGKIGSPEGLFKGLEEKNGLGCLYYSEFGSLLAHARSKYMEGVLDLLNELYDCPGYFSKVMAGGSREVENVFLNVLAASQLDSLTRYIGESALLSGFLPRFTVVYSENLQPHLTRRPPPDTKLEAKILKHLAEIRRSAEHPQLLSLTPGAWDRFDAWAQERYKRATVAPPEVQPMYGRLETHCLKYCIIVAMGMSPTAVVIDKETLSFAMQWADFVVQSYTRLVLEELSFTDHDRKIRKVAKIIKAKGTVPRRELVASTRYKNRDLEDILATLQAMGKIKQEKGPRGGKIYIWIA